MIYGTKLFQTKDADTLYFIVNDGVKSLVPDANGRVTTTIRAMQSFTYGFAAKNQYTPTADTLEYAVTVIEDALPMIAVVELRDSLLNDRLFFHGRIKDDYGFTKLEFKIVRTNVQDTSIHDVISYEIGIGKESVQEFNYSTRLDDVVLNPGDRLVYYFEIWDNDAIHNPKSATSQHFEMQVPTERELDNMIDRNSNEARESAQQSMSELKKMQQEINEMMRKFVEKKDLDWQDKRDLQELAKKQQQVKEMLQQMQQRLNENKQLEQKYKDQSEQLLEKQRELDRLMNEVMNEEMKQMMDQIDKMMKELDKKKVQEQLEQLKSGLESVTDTDDNKEELDGLLKVQADYKSEIVNIQQQLASKAQYDKILSLIDGINAEQKELVKQLAELERKEDVARQYEDRQNEILESRINEHFKITRWKMFRTVVNGGDSYNELKQKSFDLQVKLFE